MIRINLLPVRAAQKKEKIRSQLSILILSMILVLICCGAIYAQKMLAIQDVQEEISEINKKNNALKKKIGEVRNFEKKKAELEKKLGVLQDLKKSKKGPVRLLDELSTSLPKDLWLTKFQEKNGTISISGVADSENTVADFMEKLESSPYYQNVELAVTEQRAISGIKAQIFNLTCKAQLPSSKPQDAK